MGVYLSTFFGNLFNTVPARICMLGLDNAGKTTILYKLKLNEVVTTIPTIGFNVDEITIKNLTMTVWDVGGQTKIRPLWQHYFENNDALVYVVDSLDTQRFKESSEELHDVLNDDRLRNKTLLVLANKQDLPNAASVSEVTTGLKLHEIRQREWYVQACCATTGEGLLEGFTWLSDNIKKQRRSNPYWS